MLLEYFSVCSVFDRKMPVSVWSQHFVLVLESWLCDSLVGFGVEQLQAVFSQWPFAIFIFDQEQEISIVHGARIS